VTPRTILTLMAAAFVSASFSGSVRAPAHETPTTTPVIWLWERPEDVRFATPDITIAILAGSVRLAADRVDAVPRLQPARLTPMQSVIGVVHVEIDQIHKPNWTTTQRRDTAEAVLRLLANPRFHDWQIDFEVRASERHILLDLLTDIRENLPPDHRLSMTALASWCDTETWLDTAPVDDIVPMMFRMGPAGAPIEDRLAHGGDWRNPRCRHSIGIATDTPPDAVPADRRVWMFNPHSWTAEDLTALRNRLHT
jgi:hypothetical protein